MSLDVYLERAGQRHICSCPRCGHDHAYDEPEEIYSANITHNLGAMAKEAGIYGIVWRPEENGIAKAEQLIAPLGKAIEDMKLDSERYEKHNAPNGWGMYKHFLPWLEGYLDACREYPNANVRASR
jgi:hypothetical protein